MANIAMIYLFIFLTITIGKVWITKEVSRWSLLLISLSFIISMLVPTITNILSMLGKIDRGIHMLIFVFLSIIGWFTVLIIYINSTSDKITFMTKIVGTSIVTILLLIQIISYIIMEIKERDFDKILYEKSYRIINNIENDEVVKYIVGLNQSDPNSKVFVLYSRVDLVGSDLESLFLKSLKDTESLISSRSFRFVQSDFFTTHNISVPDRKIRYEIGYDYKFYRSFISEAASMIILITVFVTIAVMLIFPLFFYFNLIRPLDKLLSGIALVNHGNLDIQVPVDIMDEIGFLSQSFNSMVLSIRNAKQELQNYTENLERMVAERTRDLELSLEEVKKLKTQQDGDYYLTSLLIKPLAKNYVKSNNFNIEFFSEQKKKFKFRNWNSEIGGDLNAAHTIELRGKLFNVILNADAMGKSIQGAGGVLVLGSVFQTIIERTKLSDSTKNLFPERWLKNAFTELQSVFISFDGTMLVSMVLAIIDDETGLMYYINAEHPDIVLYRDGKADFLGSSIARKVGITGNISGELLIQTFQFQVGDVLIFGSDGRDDIQITSANNIQDTKEDERKINEDEKLFLKHVEDGKGNLKQIVELIKNAGEITDDLSLIRISFKEQIEEISESKTIESNGSRNQKKDILQARELLIKGNKKEALSILFNSYKEYPSHYILKEIIKIYFKEKNYLELKKYIDNYIQLRPKDTEYIYLGSYVNKKLKNFEYALELAERVRLREPFNVKYLANLADIYIYMNNSQSANKIIQKLEKVDRDGYITRKIKQKYKLYL